jgi:hypothetical protein
MSVRRALLASSTALLLAAAASASAAGPVHHYTFFESPSRNIGCVILDATARCDIVTRSWSPPPRPRSCPKEVDFGQGLTVSVGGAARLVCAGDTALDPRAPILAYGQVDASGSLRCTSAITGMTCRSTRSGHGFFVARQRYTLF